MTIKPGIKPASPASAVACRHAKQRSNLHKSHFRLVVKVIPLNIEFVLLNVCVSLKVKMPWSTCRDQKPVCTFIGSQNHCLKLKKKTLIYSNTFNGLKCSVFMNKHVDVFRINNLQFNYQFYISYQRGVSSFCIVSSNRQKNILDCTLIHIQHLYVSEPWVSQKYSLFETNISRGNVWIKKII